MTVLHFFFFYRSYFHMLVIFFAEIDDNAEFLLLLQRMACPMEEDDRKRVFQELALCKQAAECPYTVSYYGAFFGDVRCKTSLTH